MGAPRAAQSRQDRLRKRPSDSRPLVGAILAVAVSTVVLAITLFAVLDSPGSASTLGAPDLPPGGDTVVQQTDATPIPARTTTGQPRVTTTPRPGETPKPTSTPAPELVPRAVSSRPPIPGVIAEKPAEALQDALEDAVDDVGGGASVVVKRLTDGAFAAVNGEESWYAASLFKLAVLYAIERDVASGALHLDDRLYLTDEHFAEDLGTSGWLPFADDGSISLAQALDAMVTVSDNATAVALSQVVGNGLIDKRLADLGLAGTSVNTSDLPTTAADMALLMESIVTGRGISPDTSSHARSLLLAQATREGIPSGVGGATVGNKTGTWGGATHDVAFVDGPNGRYILAILTDGSWDWGRVSQLAEAVHEAISKLPPQ